MDQSQVFPKNRKSLIGAWCLYDFANSAFTTLVVTFVYATYFTEVLASDKNVGTTQWSWVVGISGLIIAVISPWLGALTDAQGTRTKALKVSTAICILTTFALFFPGGSGSGTFTVVLALTLFAIANITYEIGQALYNAYLPELISKEKSGTVSGLGWACGYIGGLCALFLSLVVFIQPEEPWFGLSKENQGHVRATNLLVAVWFTLFSLPFFWVISRYEKRGQIVTEKPVLPRESGWQRLRSTFKEIKKYREVLKFLVARIFYNDGLVTIIAMGGIYAAGTFNFEQDEILIFGIVLNVAAGIGAFGMGFIDDYLGGKKTILLSIVFLLIASVIAILGTSKMHLWIAGVIVGLFMGPNQSASRSFLGKLSPDDKHGEFYGFFAFSGKLTSFIGPVGFGLLTWIFDSQRAGLVIVLVLMLIGGTLLMGVRDKK